MRFAFWNIFFSFFFAVLLLVGLEWLQSVERFPTYISLGDFLLIALAVFRLVRLFTYDLITKFIRDWFEGASEGTFMHTLGALLNCPWCTGLWFSGFVVFFFFATPFAWPIILILALAGVASFIQIASNLTGWSAELKKRTVLGPEGSNKGGTCG
jgi:hypothetical protein